MDHISVHIGLSRRVLIAFVLACIGCKANSGPSGTTLDLSQPKLAALSFLHAIAAGDARDAKYASIGTEHDKRWIDGTVSLITGLRAYDDALSARFGSSAISAGVQLKEAIAALADEPVMRLEGGIVHESDEAAEVDPALNGVRLAVRRPIFLKKVKGVWKVDLSSMKDVPGHDPLLVEQYLQAGKALQRAASAVRRGRYKTLEEALSASDAIP